MNTLYIRLPARSTAESATNWLELDCPFALTSGGGSIENEGILSLSDIRDMAAKVQLVVLLLAASDVTLLRMQIPPLSPAKLRTALPNLVEDHLISDIFDSVVVAGSLSDGLRTVAVMQRAWLKLLTDTLVSFGARRFAVLPAQLCLPVQIQHGSVAAAINYSGADINLTLRFSEQDGMGLTIAHDLGDEMGEPQVLQTLRSLVPEAPITLYVPQSDLGVYQQAISHAGKNNIGVLADKWQQWIIGAGELRIDLLMGASAGSRIEWCEWRWQLVLATLVIAINTIALNIDWWRTRGEEHALRATLIQTYRSAYPADTVIIDPVAQMKQKIATARRNSGQQAPDDFTALIASFGEAWSKVTPGKPVIASLEYRERSLLVRLKPSVVSKGEVLNEAATQQLKAALAGRNLSLDLLPAQAGEVIWRIRSTK